MRHALYRAVLPMSHWKQNIIPSPCADPSVVFRVQAPGLVGDPLCSRAALDAALSLVRRHREASSLSAAAMHCMMVEPILAGTYVLISTQQTSGAWRPVGWLTYALFDADAEDRYVNNPARFIQPADWNKGDRLWMLHWIAEPGETHRLLPMVRQLFAGLTARSLPRHGRDGLTTWRGQGCSSQEATKFWQRRPPRSGSTIRDGCLPLPAIRQQGQAAFASVSGDRGSTAARSSHEHLPGLSSQMDGRSSIGTLRSSSSVP